MPKFVAYIMLTCYISSPCCMSREKVSISLDKDEKSLRTFNLQHMVKAMPLTSWHLTNFFSIRSVYKDEPVSKRNIQRRRFSGVCSYNKIYDLCFCSTENVKWQATVCPKPRETLFFSSFHLPFFSLLLYLTTSKSTIRAEI